MINTKIENEACTFVVTINRYERKIKRLKRERDEHKRRNRELQATLKSWIPAVRFAYNWKEDNCKPY